MMVQSIQIVLPVALFFLIVFNGFTVEGSKKEAQLYRFVQFAIQQKL